MQNQSDFISSKICKKVIVKIQLKTITAFSNDFQTLKLQILTKNQTDFKLPEKGRKVLEDVLNKIMNCFCALFPKRAIYRLPKLFKECNTNFELKRNKS